MFWDVLFCFKTILHILRQFWTFMNVSWCFLEVFGRLGTFWDVFLVFLDIFGRFWTTSTVVVLYCCTFVLLFYFSTFILFYFSTSLLSTFLLSNFYCQGTPKPFDSAGEIKIWWIFVFGFFFPISLLHASKNLDNFFTIVFCTESLQQTEFWFLALSHYNK